MFVPTDGAFVLSAEGKEIRFRFDPADRKAVGIMERTRLLKGAVHEDLDRAIASFRSGTAEYADACRRLEDLHFEFMKSIEGLRASLEQSLLSFLEDKAQAELARGWFALHDAQYTVDAATAFYGIWATTAEGAAKAPAPINGELEKK